MKLKFLPYLVLTIGMSTVSCSNSSLTKDIDNYFREKAVSSFSSVVDYSPFYRMVRSEEEAYDACYIQKNGEYTSIFSGETIRGYNLVKRSNEYMTWYYFEGNPNVWYDAFANELRLSTSYYNNYELPTFSHSQAIIRRGGTTFTRLFNTYGEYMENGLVLIDILHFDNYYVYKLSTDSTYDFSYYTYSLSVETLGDPLSVTKESDYEYLVSYKTGDRYYYINNDNTSDTVNVAYVSDRNLSSSFIKLFDVKFFNFDYYYYLERIDDVTNKFDFFFNEDYEKAYGIPFPAGNYRIHSSHASSYLPMRLYISENHSYAFALCLRISEDKLLLPEFNAIKINQGGKISDFTKEVELMVSGISYIYFKGDYILVDYSHLSLLDPDRCYVLTDGDTSQIYVSPSSDSIKVSGKIVSAITPENKLLFLNTSNSTPSLTLFDVTTNEQTTMRINRMIDQNNLLFVTGGRLYFQTYELDRVGEKSVIQLVFSEKMTFLSQRYISLVYRVDNSYISICCRGDIHE